LFNRNYRVFLQIVFSVVFLYISVVHAYQNENESVVLEVYRLMKEHVITRNEIDWLALKVSTLQILGDSPTLQERNEAISHLLIQTKTNHSFYRDVYSDRIIYESVLNCRVAVENLHPQKNDIGYIKVDSFSNSDKEMITNFAQSIADQLIKEDKRQLKGWIVDLTHNNGGNMWPMLAGLSPLLGNGVHGFFISPDGKSIKWGTHNGRSILGNRVKASLKQQYRVKNKEIPIAVLVSKQTASSGEAVLVSFKGFKKSRFFGQHSCGQSTSNRRFLLKNGDQLLLTTSTFADRYETAYGGSILVDELTESPLREAEDWIYSQSN
jgi:carboxyl-terminal processing protease